MKTFVVTAFASLMLAATLAPLASASSVTVHVLERSIECQSALLEYVDWQVNRMFANVHVDSDDCSPEVRYDHHGADVRCPTHPILHAFYNVRVDSRCDVYVTLA